MHEFFGALNLTFDVTTRAGSETCKLGTWTNTRGAAVPGTILFSNLSKEIEPGG